MLQHELPPRQSVGPAPLLVPGSVRRTASVDVNWPDGAKGSMRVSGRARDIVVSTYDPGLRVVAESSFDAVVAPDWRIKSISAEPTCPALDELIDQRCSGGFRHLLREKLDDEFRQASPLCLILDDLVGAMLVSGVAWLAWDPDWFEKLFGDVPIEKLLKQREGACIAHSPGFSAQDPQLATVDYGPSTAIDPRRDDDAQGWHAMDEQFGVGFRRLRRIDIFQDKEIIIDTAFQDSVTRPSGGRNAIHEYGLKLFANPDSLELTSIEAEPRVLPYPECPLAMAGLPALEGVRLPALREGVTPRLGGMRGCTHLNDALRAVADAPALVDLLVDQN